MFLRGLAAATGAVLLAAAPLAADVVETRDGARLVGEIRKIDQGVLYLDTLYAGTLEINQEQVVSFSSDDDSLFWRLDDGTTMAGRAQADPAGSAGDEPTLVIQGRAGELHAAVSRVAAAWPRQEDDPELIRERAAQEKRQRRWHYEAGLDLVGKEGNSREFGLGGNFAAVLQSPDDILKLLAEYERRQTDGEKTTDRMRGAVDYESFFHRYFGWYVRTALEKDDIERIDLRSTTGVGISYRLLNREQHRLVLRSGVGYRYTSYDNDNSDGSDPTLDLGLIHRYDFGRRLSWRNELTYSPNISEFADYRILHDSALEMPVGTGDYWKLRMGLRNDYNSQPVVDKRLDTSYYTRLILSWQ